jgi:hypothetical protein
MSRINKPFITARAVTAKGAALLLFIAGQHGKRRVFEKL